MWRVWNKLFGWGYVSFWYAGKWTLARVHYYSRTHRIPFVKVDGLTYVVGENQKYRQWKWETPKE